MWKRFKECSILSVVNQVTLEDMVEEQKRDSILGLVCQYVTAGANIENISHLQDQI